MKNRILCKHLALDHTLLGRITAATTALFLILLLTPSTWSTAASTNTLDPTGYEIPLGELKKVKKAQPSKKGYKERRKKSAAGAAQPAAETAIPPDRIDQAPAATPATAGKPLPETRPQTSPETSARIVTSLPEAAQTDPITIHHDPYSYVITGKRTIIQAVISSLDSIQSVYCRFSAAENAPAALVAMQQVPGTHFTYTAVLPSLAPASSSLHYSIIASDSLGKQARSQEFVIAVKPSGVRPGWQIDSSQDTIKIRLENREKPLEGFSDSGIVVE